MIKELLQKLHDDTNERRQTLSEIRKQIKDKLLYSELFDLADADTEFFISLLQSEDAKTRKNTALLMGELGLDAFLAPLWEAYISEEQLFVKSAYLTALKAFDYTPYLPKLHDRLLVLSSTESTPENRKHIAEEIRTLNSLIIQEEGITTHIFKGYLNEHDCILLANRDYKEITANQISDGIQAPFSAGVRVVTSNLKKLLDIRTYSELLFAIKGMMTCPGEPASAARKIAASELLSVLKKDHKGIPPFHFRIEIKSKQALDKKAAFSKKLAASLEELTGRELVNSPSDYEFELRMIENKEGNYNVLVKYMTIPDMRFDYRIEHVSASIKPVNAALMVALAKEYMLPDAQILDPFCGAATMLIERQKVVKGNTSYGIDTNEEAIRKAKINMVAAGQIIHFVNKNFFDFTHEYKFDEIFTNMPWSIGKTTMEEIYELYGKFFQKAKAVMSENGTIIMYTHNEDYAKHFAARSGYRLLVSYPINKMEKTALMVFR